MATLLTLFGRIMSPGVESASTSSSLLRRVKRREADAWRRLVHLYGPLVYSWARQLGVPPADAADVSQEVFRAVHGSIQSFRRDRPDDSFRGWLWTITRNKTGDHFRRLEGRPQSPGGSTARQLFEQLPDAPSEAATGADVLSAVAHRALELVRSEFEERTFRAFWRTAVDGQKAKDVAEELGMTLGAVYMAKSRVTRRLRDELADLI